MTDVLVCIEFFFSSTTAVSLSVEADGRKYKTPWRKWLSLTFIYRDKVIKNAAFLYFVETGRSF